MFTKLLSVLQDSASFDHQESDSPSDVCERQMSLGGLVGCDGDGRAYSNDLLGGVDHAHKVAADVAEVCKEHWVPLVQHLEPTCVACHVRAPFQQSLGMNRQQVQIAETK